MKKNEIPFRLFDNVAIAFSGGGFRAAAFSTGAISYLERIGLTDRISFISSASGGSFASLLYSSNLKKGGIFRDFYQKMLAALEGEQLLTTVLKLLNDDKQWTGMENGKERNLINSFARVYDSNLLFDKQTMAVLWDNTNRKGLEVCINTTEFYRGLSFRFQTDGTRNPKQIIGNNYLHFDMSQIDLIKKIKLADVLAASSCFPIGFEPICFPRDYAYQGLSQTELQSTIVYKDYDEIPHLLNEKPNTKDADPKQKNHIQSFGLMDGGIDDNQGLNSLMLADNKRRNNKSSPKAFDLMIITDVASYFMDNYEQPVMNNKHGWRDDTLSSFINTAKKIAGWINPVIWINLFLIVALMIIVLLVSNLAAKGAALVFVGVFTATAILLLLVKYAKRPKKVLKFIRDLDIKDELINRAKINTLFSLPIIDKLTNYLSNTKLRIFEQMLKARLASVVTMVSDVNLKQVRRLIYESFFNDTKWDNRRMPNFIYELSTHNITSRTNRFNDPNRLKWKATAQDISILLEGMSLINQVAENARLMSTTLWFEDGDEGDALLGDVVATGQFTTCLNLLEYTISLQRKKIKLDAATAKLLSDLQAVLLTDLQQFKTSPHFLFKDLAANKFERVA